jgi:Domain of unknown function (DUF4783)
MTSAMPADPVDRVTNLLGQGNVAELSKLFAPDIELTIMGQEDTYSKIQATAELNKFFDQHKPKQIQLLHKVNSNKKFLFGVAILSSTGGQYRVSYMLSETDNAMLLIELRIENEKTK